MANAEQQEIWGGAVGDVWVTHADTYDATLEPFGVAVMDQLAFDGHESVLDIGCGTGATTRQIAGRLDSGSVLGVDISEPMVTEAQRRARAIGLDAVAFRVLDVQTGNLGHNFDVAFSRVGVMFFADPVAAFTNIAGSLRSPGGRLVFICFQSADKNPLLTVPMVAALANLPVTALPDPGAPGPFSFADPERITTVLSAAGFRDMSITSGPDHACIPVGDDLSTVARALLEQNPLTNPLLAAADAHTQQVTIDALCATLEPMVTNAQVHIAAATWIVTACV